MIRVSVIICTYNYAQFIGDAIGSVLGQTFDDWELIVVDDGSTDGTREVVSSFSDPRISYIFQHNRGLPAARNTGIRHATGEFIAFLDADDAWEAPKLELQVAAMDSAPSSIVLAYTSVDAGSQSVGQGGVPA